VKVRVPIQHIKDAVNTSYINTHADSRLGTWEHAFTLILIHDTIELFPRRPVRKDQDQASTQIFYLWTYTKSPAVVHEPKLRAKKERRMKMSIF
jgi:hypothetical protein